MEGTFTDIVDVVGEVERKGMILLAVLEQRQCSPHETRGCMSHIADASHSCAKSLAAYTNRPTGTPRLRGVGVYPLCT